MAEMPLNNITIPPSKMTIASPPATQSIHAAVSIFRYQLHTVHHLTVCQSSTTDSRSPNHQVAPKETQPSQSCVEQGVCSVGLDNVHGIGSRGGL